MNDMASIYVTTAKPPAVWPEILNLIVDSTNSTRSSVEDFIDDDLVTNQTSVVPTEAPVSSPLKIAHDILIVVLLVAVMFAMGCHITLKEVWEHVRRPFGVCIGMACQFVLLPLSAYVLINLLSMDPLHATGMLILACSPGGVTSNIFTFFCEGDVSLSITMTTCSTIIALIMMPFNAWLYGHSIETGNLIIPYSKMALSLLFLTTPVAIGMLIHWKLPKVAPHLTKLGTYAGFGIIVICQTMEILIFPNMFMDVPMRLYIGVVALPVLGLCLSYLLATLFKQQPSYRRTIAIESSIQNVGTALTIASLSFPIENLRQVWLFPWLYAFSMLGVGSILAFVYRIHKKYCKRNDDDTDVEKIDPTSDMVTVTMPLQSCPNGSLNTSPVLNGRIVSTKESNMMKAAAYL